MWVKRPGLLSGAPRLMWVGPSCMRSRVAAPPVPPGQGTDAAQLAYNLIRAFALLPWPWQFLRTSALLFNLHARDSGRLGCHLAADCQVEASHRYTLWGVAAAAAAARQCTRHFFIHTIHMVLQA